MMSSSSAATIADSATKRESVIPTQSSYCLRRCSGSLCEMRSIPHFLWYSICHRKHAFVTICDGTLPFFRFSLDSHNSCLAASPGSLHSLLKGKRLDLVNKKSQLKWKDPQKGQTSVLWKYGKSLILDFQVQLERWKNRCRCNFSPILKENFIYSMKP